MSHQIRPATLCGLASALLVAAVLAGALPAGASAATAGSTTTCTGGLSPDASGKGFGEPNLLDYNFSCSADITTYTISVTRGPDESEVIDDFEGSPSVLDP